MLRRSDRTLKQCSPSVWSEGDPASGQKKKKRSGSIGLWLRPVSWDRMRPVAIPGDLDLSGIDRTLGGSVQSLPPERPDRRNRAGFQLFSVSFSITLGATIKSCHVVT